jgi:hypothetical protein
VRCVTVDGSGAVVDVVPQPADVTTCTLVLATPAEVGSSPFALSVEDATLLGFGIVAVWVTAWVIRSLSLPLGGNLS